MPRVVVRKGYRCLPGKRREVLAALQRVDAVAAESGWPRGRYLFVETRAPGEPDLEVEFVFESYAALEQAERRLREHLGRGGAAREAGSGGQEFLLEPSATRHLLLLDELTVSRSPAAAASSGARAGEQAPPAERLRSAEVSRPAPELAPDIPDFGEAPDVLEPEEPEEAAEPPAAAPVLSVAQLRAKQLAEARAAMESAESTAGLPPEKRASQRQPGQRRPPTRPQRQPEGEDTF